MLSLTQKKILKLLAINSRLTNTEIAKGVGISSETVQYHISNLIDKQNLGRFSVVFNALAIGYDYYHIFIRFRDLSKNKIDELKKLKDIFYIVRTFGKYDLQLICFVKKNMLGEIVSDVTKILPDNVQTMCVLKHIYEFKWTNVLPELSVKTKNVNSKTIVSSLSKENFATNYYANKTLEEKDIDILKILLNNPRASYVELSRATNISLENARYRLKKLVDNNYIASFTTTMDFHKFGYFSGIIMIKSVGVNKLSFQTFCTQKNNIWYASELEGEYSHIIYVIDKNPDDFSNSVDEIREYIGTAVLDIDFMYFKNELKNLQFPERETELLLNSPRKD